MAKQNKQLDELKQLGEIMKEHNFVEAEVTKDRIYAKKGKGQPEDAVDLAKRQEIEVEVLKEAKRISHLVLQSKLLSDSGLAN
jgi:hypothetical protein